jgi:N-acetylglutamate synthase-like GNAT family acetyltransferase
VIRLATRDDVGEIARLIAPQGFEIDGENVAAVWEAWQVEGNSALVIPGKNCLLGVITLHKMTVLHRPKPVGRITSLGVDPLAQGQGYGHALVDAHDFYRHLGFKQTSFRFAR